MKLHDVKLLTDENISPRVVSFLRKSGFDVLDVKEQGWHGEKDKTLLENAFHTERFVLTHDSDFGTLSVNEGCPSYGIIYLRLKNIHPVNIIKVCIRLIQNNPTLSKGSILVVEETRLRIRHVTPPE